MSTGNAPVKYVVGILTPHIDLKDKILDELSEYFGEADYTSKWYSFIHSNYYGSEMGDSLKRCFVSFENLKEPEAISEAKLFCVNLEDKFRENGNRQINLDPGYIDYFKFVLGSGKFGGHKIAINKGCWADFTLMYSKGDWHSFPWTFPDFTDGTYNQDFKEIRRLFKKARSKMGMSISMTSTEIPS